MELSYLTSNVDSIDNNYKINEMSEQVVVLETCF